ncbi:MAG: hypothetical protein MJ086_02765 [Lachnospiraceae bacterium]|nr:hypothetical protein [Lachnospiraceae bacterium]
MKIPIVIGVTGHRDLRQQDIPQIREMVHTELQKLKTEYSHSELKMLNSLACGADTICAEEALALDISLICPLPMDQEEYSKDFSEEERIDYNNLISKAEDVFVAPSTEPRKEGRDYLYRQAGIYVASHCQVLLALWDGAEGKPDGCGTAETVGFMLQEKYDDGNRHFRAANDGAVIHILTLRRDSKDDRPVTSKLIEEEAGSLKEILSRTDEFNKDAESLPDDSSESYSLLSAESVPKNSWLKRLNILYNVADRLSMKCQRQYLKAIKCFSIFGFLLVLFFLLYDELELNLFLLGYGLLILIYLAAFVFVKKKNFHDKYLQYRLLSETMRVQFYLTALGLKENVGNEFTWTQKRESTWIKEAVSALCIGNPQQQPVSEEQIKIDWIDGQLDYHKKAFQRDDHKHKINERATKWLLIASVALFVIVFAMELFLKSSLEYELVKMSFLNLAIQNQEYGLTVLALMKILLGGVSAITVFLANYYGKLSFERKTIDHAKMSDLYESAKWQYEYGQMDRKQLFRELAREEIIENGNWMSYCKENPPSFNL